MDQKRINAAYDAYNLKSLDIDGIEYENLFDAMRDAGAQNIQDYKFKDTGVIYDRQLFEDVMQWVHDQNQALGT